MRLLHKDVEFDLSKSANINLSILLFTFYPSFDKNNYERPVYATRITVRNSSTFSGIFHDKNLFRNQKSTLTAHTRATP